MKKLILLVEDNPSDEKLTVLALRKCPVDNEIAVARDGVEALDFLFATGLHAARNPLQLPSLVLLDLNLPKVDGLEVLKRVRAHVQTKDLPVVILTSSRQNEDVTRGYEFGANAYVRKPVDYGEFVEAAKTLGVFWLSMNEVPPHVP